MVSIRWKYKFWQVPLVGKVIVALGIGISFPSFSAEGGNDTCHRILGDFGPSAPVYAAHDLNEFVLSLERAGEPVRPPSTTNPGEKALYWRIWRHRESPEFLGTLIPQARAIAEPRKMGPKQAAMDFVDFLAGLRKEGMPLRMPGVGEERLYQKIRKHKDAPEFIAGLTQEAADVLEKSKRGAKEAALEFNRFVQMLKDQDIFLRMPTQTIESERLLYDRIRRRQNDENFLTWLSEDASGVLNSTEGGGPRKTAEAFLAFLEALKQKEGAIRMPNSSGRIRAERNLYSRIWRYRKNEAFLNKLTPEAIALLK